jgi:ADP-ribose pyrophosphatase
MSTATVLSTRSVYKGRIFEVTVDRVRLPHGVEHDMELVRHPGSVVMLPIPRPGEIILVRQFRYAVGRELWELPAGSLNDGEDPAEAARRECHEEIGLVPERVELVTTLWPTPGFCTERMLFYRCTDLVRPDAAAHQDEDEHVEPRTFTVDEVRDLVRSGEIADMKTVVGLTLFGDPLSPLAGRGSG